MRLRTRVQFLGSSDPALRAGVERSLAAEGLELDRAGDAAGWSALLVVTTEPDEAAVTAVRAAACSAARVLVIALSGGDGHRAEAWRLLRAGAGDVIPWEHSEPARSARRAAARLARWWEVDELVSSPAVAGRLVGRSPAWLAALREVAEVGRMSDSPVLLTGESGSGKELAARLIHELDARPGKRELVLVDCTTIVPSLSGSEFFGHERGAYTDAVTARDGAFAQADGGTLFLDELADLPLPLQGELLRVIQERMYKRVGSGVWRQTQFRLICATNRDLREEVARGRFRADLYHRVAAWTVRLPSLRERLDDVPVLAEHLLGQLRPDLVPLRLDPLVLEVLERRAYPGNVRELRQLLARLAARHVGPGPLTIGDLPADERPPGGEEEAGWDTSELERCVQRALACHASLRQIGRAAEEVAIDLALRISEGNLRRASVRLGITDRALQMRRAARRHLRRGPSG